MRRFLHLCLDRTPVVGLLMAALLFRALIPTGFMPTRADDGTLVMELCSGFTTKTVIVHLDDHATHGSPAGTPGDDHGPSHDDLFERSPCGFAVAATGAAPPATPAALVPVALPPFLPEFAVAVRPAPTILRSQSPRGPPFA